MSTLVKCEVFGSNPSMVLYVWSLHVLALHEWLPPILIPKRVVATLVHREKRSGSTKTGSKS